MLVTLFALVGAGRIVATYGILTQTYDEPAHIATGMDWLEGAYTRDYLHPPLARVAAALGPYLAGARKAGHENDWVDGNHKSIWTDGDHILQSDGKYRRNLSLARLGVLPFFVVGTVLVYVWGRMLAGAVVGVIAALLYTTLPPILAHAGLATTDFVFVVTYQAAVLAIIVWLKRANAMNSVVLGLALAVAMLSKMSAAVYLPATIAAVLAVRFGVSGRLNPCSRWSTLAGRLGLVAFVGAAVFWGGYRFTFDLLPPQIVKGVPFAETLAEVPIPAPAFVAGLIELKNHNQRGLAPYFMGSAGRSVWFFPAVVVLKTPMALLLLGLAGIVLAWTRSRRESNWELAAPLACVLVVMCISISARINMGVRHVLPLYWPLVVVAALAARWLWDQHGLRHLARIAVVVLLLWQLAVSALVHPDYLAYFNELAGGKPERFLIDSDLDWGQDLGRLSNELRARGIKNLHLAYFGSRYMDLNRHGLPAWQPLRPNQRAEGWVAISVLILKSGNEYRWLEAYEPVAHIGRSMRLYDVPPHDGASEPG